MRAVRRQRKMTGVYGASKAEITATNDSKVSIYFFAISNKFK